MSNQNETFFTAVGCMDGRVQDVIAAYGREKFKAEFPDTITEAGIVGLLAKEIDEKFLGGVKFKVSDVSIGKHNSKGVVVHGHQECAGNPVDDDVHKENIKKSVEVIKSIVGPNIPVAGVFVVRDRETWRAEEIIPAKFIA